MHKYIKSVRLSLCPKCKKPVLSHTVCLNCGFYKGNEAINVLATLTKKDKKIREKEMREVEKKQKKESGPMGTPTMEELSKK